MDTEIIVPVELFQEKDIADIPNVSDEDGKYLMTYLIMDRGLQEICHLHKVFRYNLEKLLSEYELYISDEFVRKTNSNEYGDFISINALTINYVSASKTLITAMEDFEKLFIECSETEFKIKYTKKAYDKYFSYRLMEMVRNCSQHGSLPVSVQDNKLSFDVEQLLNLFHYKHKKSFVTELIKLRDEVGDKFETPFKIAYMYCVPEYNYVISDLYYEFWGHINKYIVEINEILTEVLEKNPQLYLDDAIGFRYNESTHLIVGDTNIIKYVKSCKEEANRIRKIEQQEWFSIRKKIRDGKRNVKDVGEHTTASQ